VPITKNLLILRTEWLPKFLDYGLLCHLRQHLIALTPILNTRESEALDDGSEPILFACMTEL